MRAERDHAADGRGQTAVDYTIAIGVFLIAVVFVVGFLPSISQPFTSNQADVTKADRIADQLSEGMLGEPETPYVLNGTCTVGFFDQLQGGGSAPPGCHFDAGATTPNGAVNVDDTTGINVTIERTGGGIVTAEGIDLHAGRDPGETSSVSVTQRTVFLDGEARKLYVRVW